MKPAILFDLDGTLWNSSVGVAKAWNEGMRRLGEKGKELNAEQTLAYMGLPMDEIAKRLFPNDLPKKAMEKLSLCAALENEVLAESGGALYEGLEECLQALHPDFFIGIVSNCQAGYIEAFLKAHHLEDAFDDHLCWADTKAAKEVTIEKMTRKHDLNPVLYIGDIQKDADSSARAGVDFAFASWGFGDVPDAHRLDSLADLPDYARNWLAAKRNES